MTQLAETTVQALLDSLSEAVIAVGPDGCIRLVNRAMALLLGVDQEVLGERGQGLRPADLEAQGIWLPPALRRCLESGQRQALVQERAGRRLALTATPLPGGWTIATVRDITELDRLERQVERMTEERERFHHELAGLRSAQAGRAEVVSSSLAMQRVLELIRRVATVDSTILLLGESGVGKGVLAAEIHRQSRRSGAPFVKVDCAALPESLLESELFGYLAGSFTGARREGKAGIIEQAHGGTLFIDEIGDVPLGLQVKLLHVIQERRITRVGSVTPTPVDIRIIAATHRNLEGMVAEGRFRADLYYRLNVVPITIPPLRERPEDVPVLARTFLDRFCQRYRVERAIAPEAMNRMVAHNWPGNVRELENLMERLVVTLEEREIQPEHLPLPGAGGAPVVVRKIVPLKEAVAALELELVGAAYRRHGSSVKVSQVLGIHQTTAARKIREWKVRAGVEAGLTGWPPAGS